MQPLEWNSRIMKRYLIVLKFVLVLCLFVYIFILRSLITSKSGAREFLSVKYQNTYKENIRYKNLFEHLKVVNISKLQKCGAKEETLYIHFNDTDMSTDTAHAYKLLIPAWQKAPRKTSYFLSAVVRLRLYREDKAKWTMAELRQWIHYQLWAGTEHIYICCHYLREEERITNELVKYSDAGLVTVIDWANITAVPGSAKYSQQNADNQIGCYKHVKNIYGHLSTWMYTFDVDENPFCPLDQCEGFLRRFLRNVDNTPDKDTGVFLLPNFVLQGQGDRSRDILYDRMNRITPTPLNGNVKAVFRVSWTYDVGMHGVNLGKGKTVYSNPKTLKMLHYWGARRQNWGPDTEEMLKSTVIFNDVRETIAVGIRHSLLAFGDFDAFSTLTGP